LPAVIAVSTRIEDCTWINPADKPSCNVINESQDSPEKALVYRAIQTFLDPGKVTLHRFRSPGIISCPFCYRVPIPVVRSDNDHRVMCGAAA
jgi:hypothetical protein